MHTLHYHHNGVLKYVNSYMFRASLVQHQGVYSCIQRSLKLSVIYSM